MEQPVATPAPAPTPAPPPTVSATFDAASKGDFSAFQQAAETARRTQQPVVRVEMPVDPAPVTEPVVAAPVVDVAPVVPVDARPISKRQHATNESIREAVERATAELRAENDRLKASAPAPAPVAAPTVPDFKRIAALPDAPRLSDKNPDGSDVYASLEEHAAAMAMFVNQTVRQQEQQQAAQTAEQRTVQTQATKFTERLTAAAAADPDFLTKIPPAVASARPLSGLRPGEPATFANTVAEAALWSEHPDALLVHLHAHQDEVRAIADLPPGQWLPALARLDGRLTTSTPPPAVLQAQATAPVSPVAAVPQPPPVITRAGATVDPKQAAFERGDFGAMRGHWNAERQAKRSAA